MFQKNNIVNLIEYFDTRNGRAITPTKNKNETIFYNSSKNTIFSSIK